MKASFVRFFLYTTLILIGVSCASMKSTEDVASDNLVLFPAPPDTTRIQYLGSISGSGSIKQKKSSFVQYTLGEEKAKTINKPYGVFMNDGKIYVADAYIKGFEIIDLKNHKFDYFIPGGKGALKLPFNSCMSENGNLFVADGGRGQVVVFDADRKYLSCFGNPESMKPIDVVVYDNKLWVCNLLSHKIEVYNLDNYELLASFPESEEGSKDYLYSPTNLYVYNNKVYVSDMGDFKVKIFDTSGKYISTVGSYGNTTGTFMRPKGVAVDKDENLYVVDAGFENVQIFNKSGQLLMYFGGEYKGPGYMWLPAKVSIDYDNLEYFRKFVDPDFDPKYIIFVTNQYGPDKLSIYAFVEPSKSTPEEIRNEKEKIKKRNRKQKAVLF